LELEIVASKSKLSLFLLLFTFFFFPQLPTLVSMPLSPPTALGGSAFFILIDQKQATHGTQSMGFEAIHQSKSRCVFLPWLILLPSVKFRVNPWQMLLIGLYSMLIR